MPRVILRDGKTSRENAHRMEREEHAFRNGHPLSCRQKTAVERRAEMLFSARNL